ncbi:MAG: chlorophyllase, partial [Acidimicrobiaceae bacterium]|nr:chlorophyllase [Acidimicrobiaceae bacterium]
MIVFAHGYDVSPDIYSALLNSWVRAGFVVVAPFFPDEKASAVIAQH